MSAHPRERYYVSRVRIPLIPPRIKAVSLWMVFRIDLRNTLAITLVHARNRGVTWNRAGSARNSVALSFGKKESPE